MIFLIGKNGKVVDATQRDESDDEDHKRKKKKKKIDKASIIEKFNNSLEDSPSRDSSSEEATDDAVENKIFNPEREKIIADFQDFMGGF